MSQERQPLDLIVVGGGVIGLAVSLEAAREGLRVLLVERGEIGMEATWAAAGMLSPIGEASGHGPFLNLALRSLRAYEPWVRGIEGESGIEVEYRACGKLRVARSVEEVARLEVRRSLAKSHGVRAEWLGPPQMRTLEPALAPSAAAGLLLHEDARVDGRGLASALRASTVRAGVEVLSGREVRGLRQRGSVVDGVILRDGSTIRSGSVVLAAGAWSGRFDGLPLPIPVRPVRGQMLALTLPDATTRHILESDDVYLVPRDDGRILVGATVEEAGFVKENTDEGVQQLLASAIDLCPPLAEAELLGTWSGLRPGTPDTLPILGPMPGVKGLVVATGHYRNGILLAPITARAIADLLTKGASDVLLPELSPARFSRNAAPAGRAE